MRGKQSSRNFDDLRMSDPIRQLEDWERTAFIRFARRVAARDGWNVQDVLDMCGLTQAEGQDA